MVRLRRSSWRQRYRWTSESKIQIISIRGSTERRTTCKGDLAGCRGQDKLRTPFKDLCALKAIDSSPANRPLIGAVTWADATIYAVPLALKVHKTGGVASWACQALD